MFSPHSFVVPPGFQSRAYLFSPELMEVLKDINALTDLRDSPIFSHADASSVIQMDNQQAWIQSRLVDLPGLPFIQECCRLAAYLCASIHCCKVWRLSVMPVSDFRRPFLAPDGATEHVLTCGYLPRNIRLVFHRSFSRDYRNRPMTLRGTRNPSYWPGFCTSGAHIQLSVQRARATRSSCGGGMQSNYDFWILPGRT